MQKPASPSRRATRLIYANSRSRRLEWLRLGATIAAAGLLGWAWSLSQHYGLAPGDGGILRSAADRYLMAALVAGFGLASLGGILLVCDRYVLRIERNDREAIVTTIGAIRARSRTHPLGELDRCRWHAGEFHGASSVRAPWVSLSGAGMRLPYIIDAQAEGFDLKRIAALARAK